jgi:hypothetical protein
MAANMPQPFKNKTGNKMAIWLPDHFLGINRASEYVPEHLNRGFQFFQYSNGSVSRDTINIYVGLQDDVLFVLKKRHSLKLVLTSLVLSNLSDASDIYSVIAMIICMQMLATQL